MPFKRRSFVGGQHQIVEFNAKRSSLIIYNVGTAMLWVSDSQEDVENQGFPLIAGMAMDFSVDGDDQPWHAFYAYGTGLVEYELYEALRQADII